MHATRRDENKGLVHQDLEISVRISQDTLVRNVERSSAEPPFSCVHAEVGRQEIRSRKA